MEGATLLEAQLFGYERGAFTDARQAKPGLIQIAHGVTTATTMYREMEMTYWIERAEAATQ